MHATARDIMTAGLKTHGLAKQDCPVGPFGIFVDTQFPNERFTLPGGEPLKIQFEGGALGHLGYHVEFQGRTIHGHAGGDGVRAITLNNRRGGAYDYRIQIDGNPRQNDSGPCLAVKLRLEAGAECGEGNATYFEPAKGMSREVDLRYNLRGNKIDRLQMKPGVLAHYADTQAPVLMVDDAGRQLEGFALTISGGRGSLAHNAIQHPVAPNGTVRGTFVLGGKELIATGKITPDKDHPDMLQVHLQSTHGGRTTTLRGTANLGVGAANVVPAAADVRIKLSGTSSDAVLRSHGEAGLSLAVLRGDGPPEFRPVEAGLARHLGNGFTEGRISGSTITIRGLKGAHYGVIDLDNARVLPRCASVMAAYAAKLGQG